MGPERTPYIFGSGNPRHRAPPPRTPSLDAISTCDSPLPGMLHEGLVPRPEVRRRGMCGGNTDTQSLVSILKNARPKADLEHSIQLPIELWEKTIDYLADDWKDEVMYEAWMRELGRVCRRWHARCLFRAQERIEAKRMDKKRIYRLIDRLDEDLERRRIIKMVSIRFWNRRVDAFGTFAACMAQKLPQVERLALRECEWAAGQLHAQVFVHVILAFGSVTMLELFEVTFPSAVVFRQLVRALPLLSSLTCWSVGFEKPCDGVGQIWKRLPLRLDAANLKVSDDVVDFLALIGARLCHLTWHDHNLAKCSKLLLATAELLSSMYIELPYYASNEASMIDLTPAVSLRILSFTVELEDLARAARILSHASLPNLIEIEARLTSTSGAATSSSFIQDELDRVDKDCYAQIDQTLSGHQYLALKKFTFRLQCAIWRSKVMKVISEDSWRSRTSSKFPALHASGRLVASVSARVYDEWR